MVLPFSGSLFARVAIAGSYLEHLDEALVGKALRGRNFDAPDGKQSRFNSNQMPFLHGEQSADWLRPLPK